MRCTVLLPAFSWPFCPEMAQEELTRRNKKWHGSKELQVSSRRVLAIAKSHLCVRALSATGNLRSRRRIIMRSEAHFHGSLELFCHEGSSPKQKQDLNRGATAAAGCYRGPCTADRGRWVGGVTRPTGGRGNLHSWLSHFQEGLFTNFARGGVRKLRKKQS